MIKLAIVVIDTTKIQLFKQITTEELSNTWYVFVVIDTTKIQLFKQITTPRYSQFKYKKL